MTRLDFEPKYSRYYDNTFFLSTIGPIAVNGMSNFSAGNIGVACHTTGVICFSKLPANVSVNLLGVPGSAACRGCRTREGKRGSSQSL